MQKNNLWHPPRSLVDESNVKRFMQKHGIDSYESLLQSSTEDTEWFWDAVVRDLDIEFYKPYSRVLDTSDGIAWAKWFVDGQINIAHNCIDKHALNPERSSHPAVIWEGEDGEVRQYTYVELSDESNRLANALKSLGVSKGDAVGLYMPMTPEIVSAFMAVCKLGAILVPIFSGYGADATATRLQDCDAKALITSDGFYRKGKAIDMKSTADEALKSCPVIEHVVVKRRLGSSILMQEGRDHDWDELLAAQPSEFETERTESEDPFMIIYTSGTTGRPKGAVHVHGGFTVKIAEEVAYQCDLQQSDVLYWVTDMGWIMGPWEVVGGLALGGTIFLFEGAPDYPAPDRLWAMIERHKITTLGISPTLIRALMRHGTDPLEKHDLSSLKIIGSTGEPWNPDPYLWTLEHVGGNRCPIINLSGGTEIGACFLSPHPINSLKPCTLRGPSLGMDIDVLDENGVSVRGKVGELVCRQPWPGMTRGLWRDSERYIETYWSRYENIWHHGDWAIVDDDGFWFLQGRSDDTIKIAGKRLGPAEVESALVAHPAVAESAAIGVPHDVKGEAVWAYVVLRPGYEPSDELRVELNKTAIEKLGKSFGIDQIKFTNALPKTRNAKILRRAVKAIALNKDPGNLANLEDPNTLEEIRRAK